MSYPARLMRKRKVMDERTPSGESVDELVRRLAPSILPVLAEAPPVPVRQPPVVATSPDSPEVLGQFTPPQAVRNMSLVKPIETNNVINPSVITRPTTPYAVDNSGVAVGVPPPPEMLSGNVVRPRLINPVDPLLKAQENAQYANSSQPDYGTNPDGTPRTEPKHDFKHRLLAGLKVALPGMLQGLSATGNVGGGIGGGIAGLIAGAANPKLPAQARLQNVRALNEAELGKQIGLAGERAKIDDQLARTDNTRALTEYNRIRPQLETDKIAAKREYDSWRMKSGDRKADTYENFVKWRMENGDRKATSYEDYLDFQKTSTDRRLTEAERHNRTNEAIGQAGIGVRQESNDIRREGGATPQSTARDRAKAQSLINQARAYRARAAAAKTQEAADDLNATAQQFEDDAATQYPEHVDVQETPTVKAGGMTVMGSGRQVRVKPQGRTAPARAVNKGSAWKQYVDTYFKGDEAAARAYQNQSK